MNNNENTNIGCLTVGVKLGDEIEIGNDVKVVFSSTRSKGWISLTFIAPKSIKIESKTRRERQTKNREALSKE